MSEVLAQRLRGVVKRLAARSYTFYMGLARQPHSRLVVRPPYLLMDTKNWRTKDQETFMGEPEQVVEFAKRTFPSIKGIMFSDNKGVLSKSDEQRLHKAVRKHGLKWEE